ncbi:hypothetical protein J6590_003207 [Homalodisca vitripennis]|nr:hypothetical protein J6590_003207 [Homalodisca vitripennis]
MVGPGFVSSETHRTELADPPVYCLGCNLQTAFVPCAAEQRFTPDNAIIVNNLDNYIFAYGSPSQDANYANQSLAYRLIRGCAPFITLNNVGAYSVASTAIYTGGFIDVNLFTLSLDDASPNYGTQATILLLLTSNHIKTREWGLYKKIPYVYSVLKTVTFFPQRKLPGCKASPVMTQSGSGSGQSIKGSSQTTSRPRHREPQMGGVIVVRKPLSSGGDKGKKTNSIIRVFIFNLLSATTKLTHSST